MTTETQAFRDLSLRVRDGLTLYARHYPAIYGYNATRPRRPLLCLPGLTRNSRDFHVIAQALSRHETAPRDVYTLDSRGRGNSDHDPDYRNYVLPIEVQDALDFIIANSLHGTAILGTSRGGLLTMIMAAAQPTAVGPTILNDIGPVIEAKGLGRILAYAGRMPLPGTWAEAGKLAFDMNHRAFPAIKTPAEWEDIARQWFNERKGKPAPGYDPKIASAMSVFDGPPPPLWAHFEALTRVPILTLHGEYSDILSTDTVEEMRRRHPAFASFTVRGQGHAPMLRDAQTIAQVDEFLTLTDGITDFSTARSAI